MLAVYETIDLGLVSSLNAITVSPGEPPILDLIQGNHPVFVTDPIHEDTIYVYHAFGVHTLHLGPLLQSVAVALRAEDDDEGASLNVALQQAAGTLVQPILSTFSVERRSVLFAMHRSFYLDPMTCALDVQILWWQYACQTMYI